MTQTPDNTVVGYPERVFREAWLAIQWKTMLRTGKGYRKQPAPTRRQAQRDAALTVAKPETQTA